MPIETKVDVTFCLTDGTKVTSIENLEDVTTFIDQHEEFVKVVRCKDCRYYMPKTHGCTMGSLMCPDENDYCSRGIRNVRI